MLNLEICNRVTFVESVMRSRRVEYSLPEQPMNFYRLAAGLDSLKLYEPKQQPKPLPPPPWQSFNLGERMALLKLSGGPLSLGVFSKLIANGACYPDARNFHALIDSGYAVKNKSNRFHSATQSGFGAARVLAKLIAKDRGWHVFWTGNNRYDMTLRCTCGWSTQLSKNQGHLLSQQMAAETRHLRTVEAMDAMRAAMKPPTKTEVA